MPRTPSFERRSPARAERSTQRWKGALALYAGVIVLLYMASVQFSDEVQLEAGASAPAGAIKGMMRLDKAHAGAQSNAPKAGLPKSKRCHAWLARIRNPVFESAESDALSTRVRDPAVRVLKGGVREMYFTFYTGQPRKMWSDTTGYTVQVVKTSDWRTFTAPEPVTPTGYCSPDAPVEWQGSTLLEACAS